MPLDRHDPRIGRALWFSRLDYAVFRPRDCFQPGREIANGLVVTAVDGRRTRAECALEQGSRGNANLVTQCLVAVRYGTGSLAIQVLIECATQGDIENLDAAANREDRQPALSRPVDQRKFRGIARRVDVAKARVR